MTTPEEIDQAVEDMVWWLRAMMRPIKPDEDIDRDPYPHLEPDEWELGARVADELLSEWAHGSEGGLCAVLSCRIATARRSRRQRPPAPVVEPSLPEPLPAGPGVTEWSVPAYAPYVMPMALLRAITSWMRRNAVEDASGEHEVRVEAHPDGGKTIVYQRGNHTDDSIVPARVQLRTPPPSLPDFPDLTTVGTVISQHPVGRAHFNMPLPIGSQICITCTQAAGVYQPVVYPCPPLVAAANQAGVEIYPDEDTTMYNAAEISAWLQREDGITPDRADGAAKELAESWNEGDFDYQTVKDILGDYFTNDDPRPKLVADPLAEAFGVELG